MSNYAKHKNTNDKDGLEPESQIPFEAIIPPPLRPIDKFAEPKISCLSQRYTVSVMIFWGFFVVFGTRCHFRTAKNYSGNEYFRNPLRLNWSSANNIDSYSFWSFLLAQVPGGILAYRFPANKVFGLGIACSALLNLFFPLVNGYKRVFEIVFCLKGFAQGITLPAAFGIWRFWAPPLERSKLVTKAFSGVFAGILFGIPICEFLSKSIHWTAMFIFFGFFGIIWYGLWYWLVFEKPRDHPAITEEEVMHIENSLEPTARLRMPGVPWTNIFTSLPVYAISVANFCQMWCYFFLVYYQNKFFKHKFAFRVNEVGFVAALPYLLMTTFVLLGGYLANILNQNKKISITNARKIFICISFGLQGLFFFYIPNATSVLKALIGILFIIGFSGFAVSGIIVNYLDIAPRFASILMGLSHTFGFVARLICQVMDKSTWNTAFTTTGCILLAGAIFYGIFSSGELQSWSEPKKEEQNEMNEVAERNL